MLITFSTLFFKDLYRNINKNTCRGKSMTFEATVSNFLDANTENKNKNIVIINFYILTKYTKDLNKDKGVILLKKSKFFKPFFSVLRFLIMSKIRN